MAEYIERKVVLGRIGRFLLKDLDILEDDDRGYNRGLSQAQMCIAAVPAADVAEVRHGEWIDVPYNYFGTKRYICNQCSTDDFWHKRYICIKEKYCPNCGAKMDGKEN